MDIEFPSALCLDSCRNSGTGWPSIGQKRGSEGSRRLHFVVMGLIIVVTLHVGVGGKAGYQLFPEFRDDPMSCPPGSSITFH